ncbi:MAG: hypothetical protein WC822_04470 [Candidatus Paceibacterota bacterium]|jgi:hypothetical protein
MSGVIKTGDEVTIFFGRSNTSKSLLVNGEQLHGLQDVVLRMGVGDEAPFLVLTMEPRLGTEVRGRFVEELDYQIYLGWMAEKRKYDSREAALDKGAD